MDLVDFISDISRKFNLSKLTMNNAIYYLDYLMSIENYPKAKLCQISLCCLIIASSNQIAKYDELDQNIPLNKDFLKMSGLMCTIDALNKCEKELLSKLEWKLKVITPLHFIDLIINSGYAFQSDLVKQGNIVSEDLYKVKNKIQLLSDLIIEYTEFLKFSPSIVGMSCIIAGRKLGKIINYWTSVFECTYSLKVNEITKCTNLFLK